MQDVHAPAARDSPPFLRWAGSKRRLFPILQTYWQKSHKRYLEPFAGSACLFFALKAPRAILGDLNPELIATYLEIKYRVQGEIRELAKLRQSKKQYLALRSVNPSWLYPF